MILWSCKAKILNGRSNSLIPHTDAGGKYGLAKITLFLRKSRVFFYGLGGRIGDVLPIHIRLQAAKGGPYVDPCFAVHGLPAHRNSARIKEETWTVELGMGAVFRFCHAGRIRSNKPRVARGWLF